MPMNMDDPRVRKTRRGLCDALLRLLSQQDYDDITIKDIADEAEVARITFYRHYSSKQELLTDCLNNLYHALRNRIQPVEPKSIKEGWRAILELYNHIEEEEVLYRVLLNSQATKTVMDSMQRHLAERIIEGLSKAPVANNILLPIETIGYFIAGAQVGLVLWWLDNGKPYPAEYMAKKAFWLMMQGVPLSIDSRLSLDLPAPHFLSDAEIRSGKPISE